MVACREHKTSHEAGVLALARGSLPRTAGAPVTFIGEARYRDRQIGLAGLRRLEHIQDLLTASAHDAGAKILLADLDILYRSKPGKRLRETQARRRPVCDRRLPRDAGRAGLSFSGR